MNLIPKIAELLGVEIGEEFKLKQTNGDIKSAKYRFRNVNDQTIYEHTDYCGDWTMCSAEDIGLLVLGKHEIVKLPFKPKTWETYYSVGWNSEQLIAVSSVIWMNDDTDYGLLYCGNVFRTKSEAEAHKYEIYEKLTGKKWEK